MRCVKKQAAFQFVLDELVPIRPIIKQMFGFTYVYLEDKLLLALREANKQHNTDGIWLFTEAEHLNSLRSEFPELPRQNFWKSGRNGWVILAKRLESFEQYAFRACDLILRGDRRFGRVTRGSRKASDEQWISQEKKELTTGILFNRRNPGS
ncbi:MAG TPA: hypothetical protein VJ180_04450 [Pyrinomonadaceae bacterium]|nr:hypothetical protein [Pyrinomonadaceae bacterium]